MKDLVIGDVHFGCSSNSITWLESQLEFFRKQVFKKIKEDSSIDRIVFLGDLFDIRYSTNQQIGIEVKNLIRELASIFEKPIIFIAGNHDYYTPIEEQKHYNSYELVFGKEFTAIYKNIKFVTEDPYFDNGSLFLPWYYTDNPENFSNVLYSYDIKEIKNIYCHANLAEWSDARAVALQNICVFAGHIHFIQIDKERNFYNLGACLPLNFSDTNCARYVYIIEDNKIVEKIENTTTVRFNKYYNEEIFNLTEKNFENANTRLCIYNSNINKANYIEQIAALKLTYSNYNIAVQIIDEQIKEALELCYFNTNISNFIDSNIPEHLADKYSYIKEKIQENLTNDGNKNNTIV